MEKWNIVVIDLVPKSVPGFRFAQVVYVPAGTLLLWSGVQYFCVGATDSMTQHSIYCTVDDF